LFCLHHSVEFGPRLIFKSPRMKLTTKIITFFLVLAVGPLLMVALFNDPLIRRAIENRVQQQLLLGNRLKQSELDRWVSQHIKILEHLAPAVAKQGLDTLLQDDRTSDQYRLHRERIETRYLRPALVFEDFLSVSILDVGAGRILASSDQRLMGTECRYDPPSDSGVEKIPVGQLGYCPALGRLVLKIGVMLEDTRAEARLILLAHVDHTRMSWIMQQDLDITTSGKTYLIDTTGRLVTASRFTTDAVALSPLTTDAAKACLQQKSGYGLYDDYRGIAVAGVYHWLSEYQLCMLTEIDQAEAFRDLFELRRSAIAVSLTCILIAVLIGLGLGRATVRRLNALLVGVRRFGVGDLTQPLPIDSQDEIGRVAQTFNEMVEKRQHIERELQFHRERLEQLVAERTVELETLNQQLIDEIENHRETEKRLRRSEAWLLEAQKIAQIGNWSLGTKGGKSRWSAETFRILGLDEKTTQADIERLVKLVHPTDRQTVRQAFRQIVDNGQAMNLTCRIVRPDGQTRFIQIRGIPESNDKGHTGHIVGTLQDVNTLTQAEEERRISHERLKAVIDGSTDPIYLKNIWGQYEIVNAAAAVVMGKPAAELLGKTDMEVFPKEVADAIVRDDRALMRSKTPRVFENTTRQPDGTPAVWMSTKTPRIDADGNVIGLIGISRDITPLKKIENDLRLAKETAEIANRSKSNFLTSMSHELKTPLNAIIGFSEVLQQAYYGPLNETQTEYIQDIHDAGQLLLSLINDILDISRIDAGNEELELGPVAIGSLLRNSLYLIKGKTEQHHITVDLEISDELDAVTVWADERKLKQVLFNLLSNAAKFTPDGGRIALRGRLADHQACIDVEDSGCGVAPENQLKIFEAFFQVKSGTVDKTPGAGLGLNLSRRLVEMHGGHIWVESQGLGEGSCFRFTVPLNPPLPEALVSSAR
jgi:PAS domain S-box-containing protein